MSAEITSVFERIEPLNGTNYRSWSFSLKMLLIARDLWEVIDPESERPADDKKTAQASWDKKDRSVFATIALAMKPSEQEHIHGCGTAKEAWEHLEEVYQGKGMHRLLSLMKELAHASLPLGRDKAMKDYIRGVMQTADEIAEIGKDYKLKDPIVMAFILNGLPDQYRYLVVNLESQLESISLQDLSSRLVDEECKIGTIPLPPQGPAFQAALARGVNHGDKIPRCGNCGKVGHLEDKCYYKDRDRCDHCGAWGHMEDDCRTKDFQRRNKKGAFAGFAGAAKVSNSPVGIIQPVPEWEEG
jgi:gag-polypeptide of LTR copia-type/Domain of unknown function (DUF4219)